MTVGRTSSPIVKNRESSENQIEERKEDGMGLIRDFSVVPPKEKQRHLSPDPITLVGKTIFVKFPVRCNFIFLNLCNFSNTCYFFTSGFPLSCEFRWKLDSRKWLEPFNSWKKPFRYDPLSLLFVFTQDGSSTLGRRPIPSRSLRIREFHSCLTLYLVWSL